MAPRKDIKLRKRPRIVDPVQWPGDSDVTVEIMYLNEHERQTAFSNAYKRFEKLDIELNETTKAKFDEEEELQFVYQMLLEEDGQGPEARYFQSPDEARKYLTVDEKTFFLAAHMALQVSAVESWKQEAE